MSGSELASTCHGMIVPGKHLLAMDEGLGARKRCVDGVNVRSPQENPRFPWGGSVARDAVVQRNGMVKKYREAPCLYSSAQDRVPQEARLKVWPGRPENVEVVQGLLPYCTQCNTLAARGRNHESPEPAPWSP